MLCYVCIYAQNSMQMWSSEYFQINYFQWQHLFYFAQNELFFARQFPYNIKLMCSSSSCTCEMWNAILCAMPFSHKKCICQVIIMCVSTCCWLQREKNQVTWSSSNHMQVLQYGQVAEPEVSGDPTSPLYSKALAHNELIMHPAERTLPFQRS